jgi:Mrp family chromosome partitioning ATPase/capsular polysaccharide biosynthesis protein
MNDTTDATAIFAPLWKRKWLILIVGIVVAAATYAYYKHQQPTYGASTDIYLGGSSEVQALVNNTATNTGETERSIANQVQLINSSLIGSAVERQLLKEHNPAAASGSAEASSATGSDFILISTKANSGQGAADLANAYAQVYLQQREAGYRHNVQAALDSTRQQLQSTQKQGPSTASQTLQIQDLVNRINQLHSQLSLGDAGDQQINQAVASSVPLSPNPKRNAIFGFVLGVVLAAIAAYALSRFDRRLRSLADIESVFHLPVLAAVPSIRRPILNKDGQPIPAAALREPLRRLHTTLQLGSSPDGFDTRLSPRSVLFVSAEAGDGKSTLIAGLALVQGEAGERVAIVESDLRRPVQAELLHVDGSHGLAEVLAGTLTIQNAMQRVQPGPAGDNASPSDHEGSSATAVQPREHGSVAILPSGGAVANPPALLAGRSMPALLRSVAEDFDYVLIDAPPPLEVSDVLPLMTVADAIVIITRVGHTSEASARRLVDLLNRASHAPVIGIVANDLSSAEIEAFGFSSGYYDQHGYHS